LAQSIECSDGTLALGQCSSLVAVEARQLMKKIAYFAHGRIGLAA
jgi:hypothetical protein